MTFLKMDVYTQNLLVFTTLNLDMKHVQVTVEHHVVKTMR